MALATSLACLHVTNADENKPALSPGKPLYGTWGFDLSGADLSVKPGENFFRYVNGKWVDSAQIAADKPANTLRLAMTELTDNRLHEMMESYAGNRDPKLDPLARKVGAFYHSFMDEERIENQGAKAIATELNDVKKAKTREQLAALMGRAAADFEPSLFGFTIDMDLKNPDRYTFYLNQSGLGLPDRDYYLKTDFAAQKNAYQRTIENILQLLKWPDSAKQAKAIVDFETEIAQASWSREQQRDLVAMYNPMTVKELEQLAPGFGWKGFLNATQMGKVTKVVIGEKAAFPQLAAVYHKTPIATIQAWHAFHIADNAAPYMSKAFTSAYFELHDKTLSGQKEQAVRWKRAMTAVSGSDFGVGEHFGTFGTMGFGVGQLYTAKYFPPETKQKISELVVNLTAAYRARMEKLDWMSDETKREALKKLDTYIIKVGYPDHPRDYSHVVIQPDDVIGNVKRCAQADWAFYRARFNGPVDKSDWSMTPQTNDAYNGALRDIVFPAGILQPPVFDANADMAINYGAAGGIIGHELTHGFDDEGRTVDASGALRDWWVPKDSTAFKQQADKLGAQYSQYEPLPGVKVNGGLTMGENIADLGGLTLALDAYRASLHGKPAPVLDGFTGDQRVFLGWAQAWRGKVSEDFVRKQVVSDPHSPRQYRAGGPARNIDAWYEAFNIQPGDSMYIAPENRVRIW